MRYIVCFLLVLAVSCKQEVKKYKGHFTAVQTERVFEDSTSIRAIEVDEDAVVFAGSNGVYGYFKLNDKEATTYPSITEKNTGDIDFLGTKPAFRSLATTPSHVFMLSIAQPALLYKYDKVSHNTELVYIEDVEGVFYDAMTFWNEQEGIAMGDPVEGCLSIIMTRDGGQSWTKLDCDAAPAVAEGEAAFAASDTNISVVGDHTWILTGGRKSNVLYSPNKGVSWKLYKIPLLQGGETTGGYSMDFYDAAIGVVYGGDYLNPTDNSANIAITQDGGKNWELVAQNTNQGYKSCVQFVPGSNGNELVALGFSGISYSKDRGETWQELSGESYLSFRFLNDSTAFASGKNKVDKLVFIRS